MKKVIEKIIDWKNSIVYVMYTDGSFGFDQSSNTTEAQREIYRLTQEQESEVRNTTSS